MFTDIWKEVISRYDSKAAKLLINSIFVGVYIFLLVGIVFCRIFLGVHSLNQVMMGTVFGIYVYLVYLFYADNIIENIFNYIKNSNINSAIKLLSFTIAYFLMIQIPVEVYKLIETEVP